MHLKDALVKGAWNSKIVNHASFLRPRRNMSDNIQTNTTGRLTPCLQQKIDKTRYLVEVHFSATSTQSVEDKLKRVILHDLEHGKQVPVVNGNMDETAIVNYSPKYRAYQKRIREQQISRAIK